MSSIESFKHACALFVTEYFFYFQLFDFSGIKCICLSDVSNYTIDLTAIGLHYTLQAVFFQFRQLGFSKGQFKTGSIANTIM